MIRSGSILPPSDYDPSADSEYVLHAHSTLLADIENLKSRVRDKIRQQQAGVPTYFDSLVLKRLRELRGLATEPKSSRVASAEDAAIEGMSFLFNCIRLRSRQRLEEYSSRVAETRRSKHYPSRWDLNNCQFAATQGIDECLLWRGVPIFKSVFDFAMYPMLLWDVRPLSIIELGSGTGGSALWFADLLRTFQIGGRVYSIDLRAPEVRDPLVSFITGDCLNIECVLPHTTLVTLPHPWLIIEDMHVNTLRVLRHFTSLLVSGDYVIVEDSAPKQSDLAVLTQECGAVLRVDTRYTDFFGRNSTCSRDSVFVRL